MITKTIGQISFELKADFDFSFIFEYGEPFVVFDKQDSGNLCFGVQSADKKLFLKVAGAPTVRGSGTGEEAVARMKSIVEIYEDLAHPKLTKLISHKPIIGGYLLVFEWFDGTPIGKLYDTLKRFLSLPAPEKLDIYYDILRFHQFVNEKGYIAIDFYDACIIYNFDARQVMLCDIEFYRKKPAINDMGRMWGSTRYMSPEEFELGAEIDERSNVFCMGAAAFCLFGGEMDRSYEKWKLSESLFRVAAKATSTRKEDRYSSIGEYINAWDNALSEEKR